MPSYIRCKDLIAKKTCVEQAGATLIFLHNESKYILAWGNYTALKTNDKSLKVFFNSAIYQGLN